MKRRTFIRLGSAGTVLVLDSCKSSVLDLVTPSEVLTSENKIIVNPDSGYDFFTDGKNYGRTYFNEQDRQMISTLKKGSIHESLLNPREDYQQEPPVAMSNFQGHFGRQVPAIQQGKHFDLEVIVVDPATVNPQNNPSGDWGYGQQVGNYFLRVSYEYGHVGGCVSRPGNHAGFMIHDLTLSGKNRMMFDYHVIGWRENGKVCLGVYESASRYCRKGCVKDVWTYVRDVVLASLLTYLTYSAAIALSNVIATVSVSVLVI